MTASPRCLRIGLTGGIASGKSAVADMFAALGAPVVDTDLIAREVVAPGTPGLAQVVEAFGKGICQPDGALDRAALRQRIFTDEQARLQLQGILHPLIWTGTQAQVQAHCQPAQGDPPPYVIIVVPLLVEGGKLGRFDRIAVVDCDPEAQISRLLERDGETAESARRILAAQATREARLAAADDVVNNDSTLQALSLKVAELHGRYLAMALANDHSLP